MTALTALRFVAGADVYRAGELAARLERVRGTGIRFSYRPEYLASGTPRAVASTLPLDVGEVIAPGGSLPTFFAGLLPEGRRLTVLRSALKTSLDDELTLLLAVGADLPGDVQVVPRGEEPLEPPSGVEGDLGEQEFSALIDEIDRHGLPGGAAGAGVGGHRRDRSGRGRGPPGAAIRPGAGSERMAAAAARGRDPGARPSSR
ncbi:HipA N-terminal domain-containing protein [Herbiconiux sp. P18]|uniref:HipA N-terminal domain-containing protein n=1 Tax=Herbiconiux liangxiaofengii TaxID=3342795 RepID=UPI0035BA216F